MNCIEVVAGVIFNNDRSQVLLALRKPGQHQGNRWEFTGGKLHAGETPAAGLARELLEEIDIAVSDCRPRTIIEHRYPDRQVRLHFWDVTGYDGVPRGCEGQELRWVALFDLGGLDFPAANLPVVQALQGDTAPD